MINIPVKKYFIATLIGLATVSASLFAQDKKKAEPDIDISKVDFKSMPMDFDRVGKKWSRVQVDFQVRPTNGFNTNDWVNNVKMKITLAYPKTSEAATGKRTRATANKEASMDEETEEAKADTKYIYYRAAVTFLALKVGDSKRTMYFYLPSEIVERDNLIGQAVPQVYFVEFEAAGEAFSVIGPKGLKKNYFGGAASWTKKVTPKMFESFKEDADRGSMDTKGMLLPQNYVPWQQVHAFAPTIVREEVQQ